MMAAADDKDYVLLVFDRYGCCDEHEQPADAFLRRFERYREMRRQMGTSVACRVELSSVERAALRDMIYENTAGRKIEER